MAIFLPLIHAGREHVFEIYLVKIQQMVGARMAGLTAHRHRHNQLVCLPALNLTLGPEKVSLP